MSVKKEVIYVEKGVHKQLHTLKRAKGYKSVNDLIVNKLGLTKEDS